MREKYVLERYSDWMPFGTHVETGHVRISTATDDVGYATDMAQAEAICRAHTRVLNALVRMAQAFDAADHEAFAAFWYGSEFDALEQEQNVAETVVAEGGKIAKTGGKPTTDDMA